MMSISRQASHFLEKIRLGDTERTQEELEEFVEKIKHKDFSYYCVFSKNCILFANATSKFLLDQPIAFKYRRVVDRFLWYFDWFGYIGLAAMYVGIFLVPGWRDRLVEVTQLLQSFKSPRDLIITITQKKNFLFALATLAVSVAICYFI